LSSTLLANSLDTHCVNDCNYNHRNTASFTSEFKFEDLDHWCRTFSVNAGRYIRYLEGPSSKWMVFALISKSMAEIEFMSYMCRRTLMKPRSFALPCSQQLLVFMPTAREAFLNFCQIRDEPEGGGLLFAHFEFPTIRVAIRLIVCGIKALIALGIFTPPSFCSDKRQHVLTLCATYGYI